MARTATSNKQHAAANPAILAAMPLPPRPPPASQERESPATAISPPRHSKIAAAARSAWSTAPAAAEGRLTRLASLNQASRRGASAGGALGPRINPMSTTESEKASTA